MRGQMLLTAPCYLIRVWDNGAGSSADPRWDSQEVWSVLLSAGVTHSKSRRAEGGLIRWLLPVQA